MYIPGNMYMYMYMCYTKGLRHEEVLHESLINRRCMYLKFDLLSSEVVNDVTVGGSRHYHRSGMMTQHN